MSGLEATVDSSEGLAQLQNSQEMCLQPNFSLHPILPHSFPYRG